MKTKFKPLPITYLGKRPSEEYFEQIEEFLFDFFDKPESKKTKEIETILKKNPKWPIPYQLSPQRRHILDWYPFDKTKTLLDIGAGCGALTGLFSEKTSKTTSLELTDIRARIIAKRWADRDNIEIVCGSIEDYSTKRQFDYVNLTGVLEYAGRFAKSFSASNFSEMPKVFLSKISRYVKKGGHLFIAIENPLGIRYISGAVEDHYGELFEGVEYYPQYNGIRTFSPSLLLSILEEHGFSNTDVYLPFPDYKLPQMIVHSDYFNELNNNSLSSLLTNQEFSQNPLFSFFSEIGLAHQLRNENILQTFSNSLLVITQKT